MSPVSVGTSRSTQSLETGKAKLWILLVGINKYQDASIPALRYSALDCQGLTEALEVATQRFPNKEAIAHHDFASQTPELQTVHASLKHVASTAQSQDTVLFYFSGHGFLEPESQQAVLCLADTQKDDLLSTGLRVQELLQTLSDCAAYQQLVWLDACHSGGMTLKGARGGANSAPDDYSVLFNPTSQLVEVLRQRATQSKGFYALLSCDQRQQSWEFPELGHGVFTYYLIRGLRGEAADAQGVIEVDGLYKYVYHRTLQYVDKTNQQLRLINQQKRSRGDISFQSEYPLQTPKRIVEGVGELVLGLSPASMSSGHPRQALIANGLSGRQATVGLCKLLSSAGGFEPEYWPRSGKEWSEVREAIQVCLRRTQYLPKASQSLLEQDSLTSVPTTSDITTALLYLRGRIEETAEGEAWLVLGDGVRLSRSWLRQELRRSDIAQQIVVLDCPEANSLADWVEDLQLGQGQGQCLIAAAPTAEASERFAEALLQTLSAADPQVGLPVAGWIAQLQVELAGTGIPLHVWLSGVQGVIEVLPGRVVSRGADVKGFDLGLCPYMGLQAFGEADAQYFYGRESLTQKLINVLNQRAILAVVGASGSGKSSVVQAGLVAQLRQGKQLPGSEHWWIRSFRPGSSPMEALVQRLVDTGTEKERAYQQMQLEGLLHLGVEGFVRWLRTRTEPMVVLVVDQFEELFTLASATDCQRFLEILFGAVEYAGDRFKLVIALRADFIASCLEVPVLAPVLQQSSVLVPPCLTVDDYFQVIVKPAQQVGLQVEPELVEVLLQDLPHSAGDLPLLEFVLEQLWEHRRGGALTLQVYQQQIGGLKGVLEQKAQAVYDSLEPEAQSCARWIFLTLTQLGEGTEDTRRRVYKSELVVAKYATTLVERTLQALTAAKLVVTTFEGNEDPAGQSRGLAASSSQTEELSLEKMRQEVTIEIAHEVLIRHWSTLRWWLEESRTQLRVQRQIEQAAGLWKHSGRQSDFLLRGVRLAEAEDIYVKHALELPPDTQQFIEACLEERQQQHLQAKRRLRRAQVTAGVMSVLGFAALSFGAIAYVQRQKIQIEGLNSLSEALLLSNQQLEALTASLKAGRQVQRTIGVPDELQLKTASNLQQVIHTIQERNRLEGHAYSVNAISFSHNGKMLASASDDATVKFWSVDGSLLKTIKGHSEPVNSVSFSPDGKMLASASDDATVKLWSVDGSLLKTIKGHSDQVNSVSFSPNGKMLASASDDATVKLWSLDGSLLKTIKGHSAPVNSVSFSPDGKMLASASDDATVKLWNVDGSLLRTIKGHSAGVTSVSFSPDGKMLASTSWDNTIKLWTETDEMPVLLTTLKGHGAGITSVSFSPNGRMLASTSHDLTVKLWSSDGKELETFKGHGDRVNSVSFSPDGKTLASASVDNTVKLWSLNREPKISTQCSKKAISIGFSSDGKTLASVCVDNTVKLWNVNGAKLKTLKGDSDIVNHVSFSPDGSKISSAENSFIAKGPDRSISAHYLVKLWRLDGFLLKTFKGHSSWVNSVNFSPGGNILASASDDKTVKLWSLDGRKLKTLQGHRDAVNSVSFSPNGILASASKDSTVKLWSLDGRLLRTLKGHRDAINSVSFSPNGKILASASVDNTVKLWSVDGHLLRTLKGHSGWVNSVRFSPDGKMLASASNDSTVKLWSLDGTLLKTLKGHSDGVLSVIFSPNGKTLVSASRDNAIVEWNLELDDLLMQGCNWMHNYLERNPNVSKSERHLCDGVG